MTSASHDLLQTLSVGLALDWIPTLTLVFGGCCSNAVTLEQLTSHYPQSGALVTFSQYVFNSLYALSKLVTFSPLPRLKARRTPFLPLLLQAVLLYTVNFLNNAAFAYHIPMPVHIIFRSGGLVVSMLMGRILMHRRYSTLQTMSVLLVTVGILFTTLSASQSKARTSLVGSTPGTHMSTYATGIAILTVALFFAGFLGIVQDWTNQRYNSDRTHPNGSGAAKDSASLPWQEAMFFHHFLPLPMFLLAKADLSMQFNVLNSSPRIDLVYPVTWSPLSMKISDTSPPPWALSIPSAYVPLLLNTITQVVCISGVQRLASRVTSLTVTLVLAVRKAVSLIISVMLFSSAGRARMDSMDLALMWTGAALVFAGTIGYSIGTGAGRAPKTDKTE
ncbi:hypothetical protein CERSUDRAFT_162668 [Gelatoporia subvermispora B]|uniref:UAA transporter n=1 Tax=Ceriporiopsis subvermispora (strain B) TaxID=914234 RepID=M2R0S2_CERS8|nr:hypothetical protein CERSUDRAFT_162668 [Gelatoporia subvermispora B]